MAPIKSSLARTVGKLLGVQKDTDLSLRGDVQSNRKINISVQASGGTEITSGNNKYHVFLGSSEQNFSVTRGGTCEVLVVAGGGGGGYFYGAGGGAGGVVHAPDFPVEAGVTYKASAGNGANARASSVGYGNNGNNSYFKPSPAPAAASATNLYAMGGGGGGYSGDGDTAFPTPYKNSTGSGGGSVSPSSPSDTLPNFSTVTQHPTGTKYFNRGASGQPADNGGGGGGAGAAAGVNQDGGITDPASPGGAGRPFSNFPAPVLAPAIPSPARSTWSTAVGPTGLFGGGGTGYNAPANIPRTPGGGGGWDNPQSGIHHGVDYTGGGGSGPNPSGGTGGAGIVIVYYPTE